MVPRELGLRMPAETDPHERTLMAWPTEKRRAFWKSHVEEARDAWAVVARAIAAYEPVTMVVEPAEAASAAELLGGVGGVEIVEIPIDDSWMRDSGPVVLCDPTDPTSRLAVQFGFNAWGGLVEPWDSDAVVATAVAGHVGLDVATAPFVLEGGSVAVDGDGMLVTTRSCMLNPNRGEVPAGVPRTEESVEPLLREWFGVDTVVWLEAGLADDTDTDGHVDNVVAFARPGVVLLQGCDDPADPDSVTAADSRRRLAEAGLVVAELPVLPRVECFGDEVEVPYVNLYAGNGFVMVPVAGIPADDDALSVIGSLYPGRDVVPVPGAVIAYGGGGPHCITQQVPA